MDTWSNRARFLLTPFGHALLTRFSHALRLLLGTGVFVCACCPPQDTTTPVEDPGLFGVGRSEVTVGRPDDSTFSAVVHYPLQMNKEGAPASRIAFPVPVISFGHAYQATPDIYASTLDNLASHGYIVIASRSGSELFPDHAKFADDMGCCLTFLADQTNQPDSPWYQQIDVARLGLLGHSMGGGAAMLAAADDERIKAVASMAAAETRPSAIDAAARVTAPSCFLIGTEDQLAPPQRHAIPIYDAATAPKLAIMIEGGCHCGFLDAATFGCDTGSIDRTDQLAVTWDRLVAFFDLYLREVPEARARLLAPSAPGEPVLEITFAEAIR